MSIHWLLKPFVNEKMNKLISSRHTRDGIAETIENIKSGDDRIFFNAPVVIVGHVPVAGDISLIDSTIGLTYGMLAAHAMGLGSCWMGFTLMATKKNRAIHQLLKIPKGRIISGVVTLGYPSIQFLNIPVRNERNVEWID